MVTPSDQALRDTVVTENLASPSLRRLLAVIPRPA